VSPRTCVADRYGGSVSTPIDERERLELCDLFEELGPDAPTLCEGWSTADLAAHLVLREHFHRWPDDRLAAEKAKGYEHLVARLRQGAPLVPWRIPGLRGLLNGGEYVTHHEDVRRANGYDVRPADAERDEVCWRMAAITGRRLARRVKPYGIALVRPDGTRRELGDHPRAVLSGAPVELVLFLSGRRGAAQVGLDGDPAAVAKVQATSSDL
jgi:uncharacterized protein (TIGR03085 family)